MPSPSLNLPRIMYFIAGFVWVLLLWPMPTTVFLAACFACLVMPLYRGLRRRARRGRRRIELKKAARRAELERQAAQSPGGRAVAKVRGMSPRSFGLALRLGWYRSFPMLGTFFVIVLSVAVPVLVFVLLVTPQIASGFARLRQIWEHNLQLPPELTEKIDWLAEKVQSIPGFDVLANDVQDYRELLAGYLSNFSTDTLVRWANQGFNLLGGASSVALHFVIFLALSIIFIVHAPRIRLTSARLLRINPIILKRFTLATRQALRAILLGIVVVAVIQGVLCAIGFALVGVNQFAFWGLLATLVAPIPMIGTALVWLPLAAHLWVTGHSLAALVLCLWGAGIVSTADNIFRPMFLKTGIRASFLVLILVIICGIIAFGSVGIILGPVLLALSIQAMEEGDLAYPSMLRPLAVRNPACRSQENSEK